MEHGVVTIKYIHYIRTYIHEKYFVEARLRTEFVWVIDKK